MQEKYAKLLLQCLNIKKNQPLLINCPLECYEFVQKIVEQAYQLGITDIYFDWEDEYLKKLQLENLSEKDITNSSFYNKKIYDEYAKKNSAFLPLKAYEEFDINNLTDIFYYATSLSRKSCPIFKEKQLNYDVPWCIAGVATKTWAKKMFGDSSTKALWDIIYKLCLVDKENPYEAWQEKNEENKKKCAFFNKNQFVSLNYKNSMGTDLTVNLPPNHIWEGSITKNSIGNSIMANMPSEEIFTTPYKYGVNGIVYSSKPLIYNGVLIDEFMIKFKDGKVIDYKAKKGFESLKKIIETDSNSCYLGEIALVDYDSSISKTNLIFYETLYDENAACHLALGNGFVTCLNTSSKDEIDQIMNSSIIHVDFMIGTDDLEIIAIDKDNKQTPIFKNGNFVKELL